MIILYLCTRKKKQYVEPFKDYDYEEEFNHSNPDDDSQLC